MINVNIVYKLENWSSNPFNNFPVKNCLFGTVTLMQSKQLIYSGCGIISDRAGSLSFGNEMIFGIDNSASKDLANPKKSSNR